MAVFFSSQYLLIASNITLDHPRVQSSQMSLIHPYYDPTTEFDRLFGDSLAAQFCPRASAPSTEAKHATSRRRGVYHPR